MTDSEKLDLILSEIQIMKGEMQNIKADTQELKEKVSVVENKVTGIYLTLENEIRVNIRHVAEGHLDLSRNLHEAMKPSNELEMLSIKVRTLETDVRALKSQLA